MKLKNLMTEMSAPILQDAIGSALDLIHVNPALYKLYIDGLDNIAAGLYTITQLDNYHYVKIKDASLSDKIYRYTRGFLQTKWPDLRPEIVKRMNSKNRYYATLFLRVKNFFNVSIGSGFNLTGGHIRREY